MYLNLYKCIQQIMGTVDRTRIQQFKLFVCFPGPKHSSCIFILSIISVPFCYPAKDQAWETRKDGRGQEWTRLHQQINTAVFLRKSWTGRASTRFSSSFPTKRSWVLFKDFLRGRTILRKLYSVAGKEPSNPLMLQNHPILLRRKLPERTTSRARLQRTHQMPYC